MLFVFAMFSTPTFTAFTAIVEPTVVFSSAKYCGIYSSVGVAGKVFVRKVVLFILFFNQSSLPSKLSFLVPQTVFIFTIFIAKDHL